jgi:hypothetical protein
LNPEEVSEMDEFERELDAPPATRWEHSTNPLVGRLTSRYTTLNGQPVHSYTSFFFAATIFNNRFLYIDVPHRGCA